jgi:poly-gamma-glutamate synthesis protein (capsule biosynthesis protein)
MVDRGVENSVKNNMGGDFGKLFEHIGDYFKSADFVFGNIEGPVSAKGPNVGSRFSFAMDTKILPVLVANNFKIVSFANNHVGDRSNTGFVDTLANFDANGLLYAGAGKNSIEASTVKTVESNGIKIGFIACSDVGPDWLRATETNPGQLLCSNPKLGEIIATAKTKVDFLVFSAHWGAEYRPRSQHQVDIAHSVIDNGADMVIGHHPHVIQATEWYKDKFIAYSLGNFIFDQYFSDPTMQGLVIDAIISPTEKTQISLKIVELSKDGNKYQPRLIRDATEADFITRGVVAAQTCPSPHPSPTLPFAGEGADLWLAPVGPDLDIGNYVPKVV